MSTEPPFEDPVEDFIEESSVFLCLYITTLGMAGPSKEELSITVVYIQYTLWAARPLPSVTSQKVMNSHKTVPAVTTAVPVCAHVFYEMGRGLQKKKRALDFYAIIMRIQTRLWSY